MVYFLKNNRQGAAMEKTTKTEPIKISVSKVVEFILRCGDIDSGFNDTGAMYKGAAAHRKIQKAEGANYHKEVSLKHEFEADGIVVILQGRADGIIISEEGHVTIDEIKTTTLSLDNIYKQHRLHLGQGMCYAYMYLKTLTNPPKSVSVQLTHYQLDTQETRRHSWEFTHVELEDFFIDLMCKYALWLKFERDWQILRGNSISETNFPFSSYRKGQRELAVAAYRSISASKNLYVSAPTGIGKTLSALFPSIKAMGEGKARKLFYLTAKTITRAVAEDALKLMTAQSLRFKSLTLRAKEKICINKECICSPAHCIYAKGHYERVNAAIKDLIENNDLIIPSLVEEYAKKHVVCPYELSLDTALWCDLVIGDYNHVFDPTVYLRRFFSDENKEYVFLIDEAHNLLERVRDMYTATLGKGTFSGILSLLKDKDAVSKKVRKYLRLVASYLLDIRKNREVSEYTLKEIDLEFVSQVTLLFSAMEEWLAAKKNDEHEFFGEILDLYFDIAKFLLILENYDEHYTTLIEIKGADVSLSLFCIDPSKVIRDKISFSKSSVFFSATLTPLPFYRSILGGSDEDNMLLLPSPFDPSRLLSVAHCGISTKYKDREGSYTPIAETIYAAISCKKGNYLVFFPSYEYLRKVYECFNESYPQVETLVQQNSMTDSERSEFLARFDKDNKETLLGFAVLGGIFSEGVDLKGDRLIGSIIVSVGIPKISFRQNIIRDYYEEKNAQGYDYAYTYPGMNKVLQAAGRVIRCESDAGLVLLIDSRFANASYRNLLPEFWQKLHLIWNEKELRELADDFYNAIDRKG